MDFSAQVTADGTGLKMDDAVAWRGDLLRRKGKRVVLTLRSPARFRSSQQNRYYRGPVCTWVAYYITKALQAADPAAREVTAAEAHERLKEMFLRPWVPNRDVLGIQWHLDSTTDLSTAEFSEYIERIRRHFGERGCYIPQANEHDIEQPWLADETAAQ